MLVYALEPLLLLLVNGLGADNSSSMVGLLDRGFRLETDDGECPVSRKVWEYPSCVVCPGFSASEA